MKIMMVRPRPSPETIGLQHLMVVEPLELEVLAALVREKDQVVLVDMILERKPWLYFLQKHQPDIICISGYITHVGIMLAYCQEARRLLPACVTMVGGVHCEVCPEDFDHPAVDFRVVRNAVNAFPQLLEHIEGRASLPPGVLKPTQLMIETRLPAFDFRMPVPDRSISQKYRHAYFYIFHRKIALLKTSFGCPYTCAFCFCRQITRDQYFQRSVSEVMDELQAIRERNIYIVDDDFLFDRKWLKEFIEENRRRGLRKRYLVYGRADFIARNADLIAELREVGLQTAIVGFESFSEDELDAYQKNTSPVLYRQTMEVLRKNRIDCFATIILSPDWDRQDFRHMTKSLKSLGIQFVNLQPLTPLPGTGLQLDDQRIVLSRQDYPKWDLAHVSVMPSRMSVADFYRETLRAYNAILFQPKVLLRYLFSQSPLMLWKMLVGSWRVTRQYQQRIKEAEDV